MKYKQGRPNLEMQRKMNEEVMGLYKEHGVNPAGGCLPLLLQIPIMFAFYQMLVTAVELRGAPWALWIHDLSAADPYYVLPIVMGATQFLQVKLSPQTGDPMRDQTMLMAGTNAGHPISMAAGRATLGFVSSRRGRAWLNQAMHCGVARRST